MINLSTQRKGSFGFEIKQLKPVQILERLKIKPCFQCLEAACYDLRVDLNLYTKLSFPRIFSVA